MAQNFEVKKKFFAIEFNLEVLREPKSTTIVYHLKLMILNYT